MTTIKRTEYTLLAPGLYPATITEVMSEAGQYGEQVKLVFALDDDEEAGIEDRTMIAWASASFGPKAKLFGWTKVLLFGGRDIPADMMELDTDMLKGKRCLVSVGEKVGTDGTTFNRVMDLLPLRPSKAATIVKGNGSQVMTSAPLKPRAPVPVPSATADPGDVPAWLDEAGRPVETL